MVFDEVVSALPVQDSCPYIARLGCSGGNQPPLRAAERVRLFVERRVSILEFEVAGGLDADRPRPFRSRLDDSRLLWALHFPLIVRQLLANKFLHSIAEAELLSFRESLERVPLLAVELGPILGAYRPHQLADLQLALKHLVLELARQLDLLVRLHIDELLCIF